MTVKADHEKQYPGYKFAPRRPEEIVRRKGGKKATKGPVAQSKALPSAGPSAGPPTVTGAAAITGAAANVNVNVTEGRRHVMTFFAPSTDAGATANPVQAFQRHAIPVAGSSTAIATRANHTTSSHFAPIAAPGLSTANAYPLLQAPDQKQFRPQLSTAQTPTQPAAYNHADITEGEMSDLFDFNGYVTQNQQGLTLTQAYGQEQNNQLGFIQAQMLKHENNQSQNNYLSFIPTQAQNQEHGQEQGLVQGQQWVYGMNFQNNMEDDNGRRWSSATEGGDSASVYPLGPLH